MKNGEEERGSCRQPVCIVVLCGLPLVVRMAVCSRTCTARRRQRPFSVLSPIMTMCQRDTWRLLCFPTGVMAEGGGRKVDEVAGEGQTWRCCEGRAEAVMAPVIPGRGGCGCPLPFVAAPHAENLRQIWVEPEFLPSDVVKEENIEPTPLNIDYGHVFRNSKFFESHIDLIQWVRDTAKALGFVVILLQSEVVSHIRKGQILFGYERSGKYQPPKQKNKVEVKQVSLESTKEKLTGTKKCEFPFRLKAYQFCKGGHWALQIVCGSHNHPIGLYLEGYSFAGRLNESEIKRVVDMSKTQSKPKQIFHVLHASPLVALNHPHLTTIG